MHFLNYWNTFVLYQLNKFTNVLRLEFCQHFAVFHKLPYLPRKIILS